VAKTKTAPALADTGEELVALAVLLLRRLGSSQSEVVLEMRSVGFTTTRIATLLGTTPNTVNQVIQKAKRKAQAAGRESTDG
jgi:DNA-directed RNA polymerase specialized sigma24 family protein